MARFGTVPGPVARAPEPGQGIFNVSAVPWTSFTGFNLNLQKGYGYLPPIFTLGKYRTEHGRTLLPLAVQVHHAAADGFHVGRLFPVCSRGRTAAGRRISRERREHK